MNKLDFLRRLDKELSVLEKEERREILAFYEERFYTGTIYENKTEEQVIAELESPETIARNVLEEYGVSPKYVKKTEERYQNINTVQVLILIAFDVIVASWLIPTLFSAALSIFGSSLTWFGSIGLLLNGRSTVDEFVFAFVTAGYVLLFLFGLVVLGAGIFVTKKIVIWHLNVFKIKGREKWIKKMSGWSVDAWFRRHRTAATVKNVLLVGSLAILAYTGFWIFNHYDWVEAEYGRGDLVSETVIEDFSAELAAGDEWDIVTDFGSMDVDIVLVSGSEFKVKYDRYEEDDFDYEFDYDNNVLTLSNDTIDYQVFWNFTDIFRFIGDNQAVRIEVPDTLVLKDAEIATANGEVDIRNVDFDTIDIDVTNGRVVLTNVELGTDLEVDTTNGEILVQDVIVAGIGTLDLHTSNGTITVENVNFAEYYISTTNGRVNLENLNVDLQDGLILDVDATNGALDLTNVYVDDIDLNTTNGDIDYYNDDTDFMPTRFDRDTTNGDVSTNVR